MNRFLLMLVVVSLSAVVLAEDVATPGAMTKGDVAHVTASGQPTPKLQQFVYVLKVTPAFHDESKWTQKENDAVDRHFARLTEATKAGRVIFAGRTSEPLEKTFGLVVFEAEDESVARQFMESDPAVVAGVMSATLHPYVLALQRRQ